MAVTPIIKGIGTIVWGSGNVLAAPAGAIIESLSITPKNGEPIEIEDNNGLAAVEVLLRDGFDAKASVMYDSAKAWPIEASNVALNVPFNGGSANSYPYGESSVGGASYANGVATYTCLVAAPPEDDYNRKKERMLKYSFRYRPNVSV